MKMKKIRLDELLKEAGVSQLEVSKETGIQQPVISRYKKGMSTYKIEYLFLLKEFLSKRLDHVNHIDDLFEDVEE